MLTAQAVWAIWSLKVPGEHLSQTACPVAAWNSPEAHSRQAMEPEVESYKLSKLNCHIDLVRLYIFLMLERDDWISQKGARVHLRRPAFGVPPDRTKLNGHSDIVSHLKLDLMGMF